MGELEEPHDSTPSDTEPEVPEEAPEEAPKPEIIDAVEIVEAEKSEAEVLQEKLEATQARLRTVSKAYTDLQSEMTAFRDRMEAQAKVKAERQAFEAVGAFLDPVQNLKRSIAAPGADMAGLLDGLSMVEKQFLDALTKLGLEEVPGEGAVFNPKYHEALAVSPVTDPDQDGKVLVVHQGGFVVNGKVLQAAQVVIGKYEAPASEAPEA